MIAYEVLVQTLADWKSGVRPTAPVRSPIPAAVADSPSAAQPEMVEEIESGVLSMGEGDYAGESGVEDATDGEADVEWSETDEQ